MTKNPIEFRRERLKNYDIFGGHSWVHVSTVYTTNISLCLQTNVTGEREIERQIETARKRE